MWRSFCEPVLNMVDPDASLLVIEFPINWTLPHEEFRVAELVNKAMLPVLHKAVLFEKITSAHGKNIVNTIPLVVFIELSATTTV